MFSSLVVLSVFLVSASPAYPADGQTTAQVITFGDVSKFEHLPKGAELIPPSQDRDTRGLIQYSLGQRVSNGRLVSEDTDQNSSNTTQNVQAHSEYPYNGEGPIIANIQVEVNEIKNSGQACVISGGIGQRGIVITVVLYTLSLWFDYTSRIYGF